MSERLAETLTERYPILVDTLSKIFFINCMLGSTVLTTQEYAYHEKAWIMKQCNVEDDYSDTAITVE